jgi:nitrate/TMAO reductase-like tetraheme cytochrome c subunit
VTEPSQQNNGRLPSVFYNLLTLGGATLAGLSLSLILFLFALEALSDESHPYMGIIAFVILPVFLLIGVFLVILGMTRQLRLRRRGLTVPAMPRLDLNDPRQRRAVGVFGMSTILLIGLSAFGSFQAYEYTESNEFCGTTCHTVMHPEYEVYETSPHARVDCVECHIGSGATWFVRSKLSGAYQLYAVLRDSFPRPIPTPIQNLRPSRDTCEECHWPAHFYNQKLLVNDYYLLDENNTHMRLGLLMKTGGGSAELPSGIHWHMHIQNEISYYASDEQRQNIPWVRSRSADGEERVYVDAQSGFSTDEVDEAKVRRMDCLDCHNRPTHNFRPPSERLNKLLSSGRIDPSLPSIKTVAVQVLEEPYESAQEAQAAIAEQVLAFYRDTHPEVLAQHNGTVDTAIDELQRVYRENYFPTMGVNWRAFPDNRGHLYAPGCFRCHNGNHVSDDGSVLSRDCQLCHTLVVQETASDGRLTAISGVPYRHPVDIGEMWKEMSCSDCHGG